MGPGGGGAAVTDGEAGGTKATPDPLSPSRNKEVREVCVVCGGRLGRARCVVL